MLVIGSAQAVNILISIVRMKALAVLLGPGGIGLLSIYNSLLEHGPTNRRPRHGDPAAFEKSRPRVVTRRRSAACASVLFAAI